MYLYGYWYGGLFVDDIKFRKVNVQCHSNKINFSSLYCKYRNYVHYKLVVSWHSPSTMSIFILFVCFSLKFLSLSCVFLFIWDYFCLPYKYGNENIHYITLNICCRNACYAVSITTCFKANYNINANEIGSYCIWTLNIMRSPVVATDDILDRIFQITHTAPRLSSAMLTFIMS